MADREIALYHPLVDPEDAELVNTAALYWDELQTIVPETLENPYRQRWSAEAARQGFLRPRRVNSDAPAVTAASQEVLEDYQAHNQYGIVTKRTGPAGLSSILDLPHRLHRDKMSPGLFAVVGGSLTEFDLFHTVPPPFFVAYMTRLAARIAQDDETTPLTDFEFSQDVLIDGRVDLLSSSGQRAISALALSSLRTIAIRGDVPLLDILRFRDRYRDQLLTYRKLIRRLDRLLGAVQDPAVRQRQITQIVQDEIVEGLHELEARLQEGRIGFVWKVIETAVGAGIGWIASGEPAGAVVGGIVTLGFSTWEFRRGRQQLSKGDPLGYLMLAKDRLGTGPKEGG